MTDTITLPRQTVRFAVELLNEAAAHLTLFPSLCSKLRRLDIDLRALLRDQPAVKESLIPEQQQAEPVQNRITHITWDERGVRTVNGIPDDAPQRTWVGLTDEEMMQIYIDLKSVAGFYSVEKYARAISAKLRSKNDH